MKLSVLSCMVLLIAMAVVGCTKSPTTQSKAQPATGGKKSVAADTTQQPPGPAPAAPTADTSAADMAKGAPPADTTPTVPPADTKKMDTPATEPDTADVTPPAEAAAAKLPYEDLVAALGNEQATEAYRQIERQLAENPADLETRARRALILNMVGSELARGDKRDKGLEVFGVALEQAQALVASEPSLPDYVSQALCAVYYNGACAQSLGGKPEDAKTTLAKAVELGFSDLNAIKTDEDLAAVRALAGFDQQLEAWSALIQEALAKQARAVLAAGESFPFDFALADLAGQNISLASYQGKVLIVDIWGTWCPPCRAEIPSFVKLQTEYGPQGLQIVGLNYENNPDEAAAKEGVQKFMQDNGMNYPCALGTEEIQRQVPNFEGFPTTLFIDRSGKVRAKVVGAHDYAFLEAIVKILLEEAAPPAAIPAATPPAATPDVSAPPAAPDPNAPPTTPEPGQSPAEAPGGGGQ
jgi:thiol-disulfide isomerase/thioredoxin